jgi:hypothetical protein
MLDGIDMNDSVGNRIGCEPNVDAIEEVKVITGNGSSEFGNVGGAVVNISMKGGTNQYHGNVFEFLRNDKLDANGFFANRSRAARRAFRRNIFGGTLGGPVKHNKAFFFMDYEGTEQRGSGPANASVAPAAWRTGDLSDFLTRSNQIVRDPPTGPDIPSRQPFAGNIIPAARITNPVARALFSNASLYPLPNVPGTGALAITNNYLSSSATKLSNHQADVKGDFRLTEKDNVSMRWSTGRYESVGSREALLIQMSSATNAPTQQAVLSQAPPSPRIPFRLRWASLLAGLPPLPACIMMTPTTALGLPLPTRPAPDRVAR